MSSRSPQCCCCHNKVQSGGGGGLHQGNTMSLPIVCLIPKNPHGQLESKSNQPFYPKHQIPASKSDNMEFMDEEFLKTHFKVPKRALYLDPMRRPLITFPMTQEDSKNFNLARKYKINQQILDGILDPSAAISAPSVFPYANENESSITHITGESDDDDEVIYIIQLPDYEPTSKNDEKIITPRFVWHACKKVKSEFSKKGSHSKFLDGPPKKPKPWLLSRHTDFDLLSQCVLPRPNLDSVNLGCPIVVPSDGKAANYELSDADQKQISRVIEHLSANSAIPQQHCTTCKAGEPQTSGSTAPNYIPVIILPSTTMTEVDKKAEVELNHKFDAAETNDTNKMSRKEEEAPKESNKRRMKPVPRLTDFDLLSQW